MIKIFTLTNLSAAKNKPPPTLVAKSHLNLLSRNEKGFSLIEIIIVIMIIGGVLSASLSRMNFGRKVDNRTVFRDIVISVKEIRNRAKLYSTTYRLVFKIDEKEGSYWVEKSTSPTLIDKEFLAKQRERGSKDEEGAPPSPFQVDTSWSKKEKQLPSGYTFKQLESGPQDVVITEGLAYIHFFAQGMIEPVALQIQDPKKNIWTLVFNPLTGQADIIDGAKALRDINRQ